MKLPKQLRAWNTAAAETLRAFASNELTQDGEWLRIAPWGKYPNKVGLQVIEAEDGQAMVTAFNSLRSQVKRAFLGLPIYVGHPDMDPASYPDKRRYGKVTELDSRADGLYGKVAWNSLGKQVIEDGQFTFASPTWFLRRDGKTVRPTELISVGLTNTPNIPGDPWAKNETDPAMPKWLVDLLVAAGLVAANESDEAKIKTAANDLAAKAKRVPDLEAEVTKLKADLLTATNEKATLTTERDTLKTQLTAANNQVTNLSKARAERETEIAVNEGRITQADRAAWNEKLVADFDTNAKALRERKVAINTTQQSANLGQRKSEVNVGTEKIVAINDAIAAHAKQHNLNLKDSEQYHRAHCAVKREKPELFAAS